MSSDHSSPDHPKISRFKVVSSRSSEPEDEGFSFIHHDPEPFDLRAESLGGGVYSISQKVTPSMGALYTGMIAAESPRVTKWAGVSRCGQYAVSISPNALKVKCGLGSKDGFLFYHPLTTEEYETHFENLIRDAADPMVGFSLVGARHELFLKRPEFLSPDTGSVGNILDRLYFQFSLAEKGADGEDLSRVAFEVPILKSYGAIHLQVESLQDAITALQAAWMVRFEEF